MIKRIHISFLALVFSCLISNQMLGQNPPSELYKEWLNAQTDSTIEPVLPTFSFAGYHNGEIGIPEVSVANGYKEFDVTNTAYAGGAVANDGNSDKAAIKAAIAAAESYVSGGSGRKAIVKFPAGKFIINTTTNSYDLIKITKSNIVVKGAGSGTGGTELFHQEYLNERTPGNDWSSPYLFQFNSTAGSSFRANVTANATRETFTIQVNNTNKIVVGDWVELRMFDMTDGAVNDELLPYRTSDFFKPNELKISSKDPEIGGVRVSEYHKVVSKTATSLTFKEPIHKTINSNYNWNVYSYNPIEEVGIQDLKYTGGFIWKHIHHTAPQEIHPGEGSLGPNAFKSASGWSGIEFNQVANGWVSNVEFSAMSNCGNIKKSAYCSIINNRFTGNPGHIAISANGSTGVFLGRNMDYTTGIWHGCGVNSEAIGNVHWRNEHPMTGTSGMESHGSQPRATLFDVCKGGIFLNMGGSDAALPNHLRHMVLWNFEGYAKLNEYSVTESFIKGRGAKVLMPIISGLKGFRMSTGTANQYDVNESEGTHVKERSLYEHQLIQRLGGLPDWLIDIKKTIVEGGENVIYADNNPFTNEISINNLQNKYDVLFVIDPMWEIIAKKEISGLEEVDVYDLFEETRRGVYFIKVFSSDGKNVATYKLIRN